MIRVKYLFAFGFAVFVGVFAAFAPAAIAPRFAQFPAEITYSAVEGTLWNMTITNTHWRSRPLGDVFISLSPVSAFLGQARGMLKLKENNLNGSAIISIASTTSLEKFEFEISTQIKLGEILFPADVIIRGDRIEWDRRGRCLSAQASLSTNLPAVVLVDFQENITDTVADIRCDDGRLLVVFSQGIGFARLSGTGVFTGADALDLELVLRFVDQTAIPEAAAVFVRRLGFTQKHDGWYSEVTLQL